MKEAVSGTLRAGGILCSRHTAGVRVARRDVVTHGGGEAPGRTASGRVVVQVATTRQRREPLLSGHCLSRREVVRRGHATSWAVLMEDCVL